MTRKIKIGVAGAAGRMGRQNITNIINHTENNTNAVFAAALEHSGSKFLNQDATVLAGLEPYGILIESDLENFTSKVDAIIDFTTPESTLKIAEIAAQKNLTHVIGTTGLTSEQEDKLKSYSRTAKIIYAPNMSLGVNVLLSLVEKVSQALDDTYDIEIVEMHHNKKVDAPSGTALGLGKAAAKGRNVTLETNGVFERYGQVGARKKGEIGFATLRGGDVVGDHTVIFAAEGERTEITHKASNRGVFSRGAVKAAIWGASQPFGFYSMKNVLQLD